MKILLFTQHYPPDFGAQSFSMQALVKVALERDHKVIVITGEPNRYSIKKEIYFKKIEKYSNLEIYRIKGIRHKNIFWKRPLSYISFMINSLICAFRLKQKNFNLVIVTSPPTTSAITAFLYCFFKRLNFVLEIRDLWPETLVDLKVFKNKIIINLLIYIEKLLYKKSNLIIVVSEGFKKRIISKGVNESKIVVFTNGLDRKFILKSTDIKRKTYLRKYYKLPDKKTIVSYVGNIGVSQNLEIIINAAEKLHEDVFFLIVGEGLEKKRLLKLCEENNLSRKVLFLEGLPRYKIIDIYKLSDILFLQLKNIDIFKDTIPSKIFEYLGSSIPIIYGLNGIAANILKKSGNGIKIRPECDEDLVEAIKKIKREYDIYVERAKKGRDFVVKNYLREKIMKDYVSTLERNFS